MKPLTVRERAIAAAENYVYRANKSESEELVRLLTERVEQLRGENDVLALGLGEALTRIAALEKASRVPVTVPLSAYEVPPEVEPITNRVKIAAIGDLRARWAS